MKRSKVKQPDILFVLPPVLRFLGKSSTDFPLGLGYMVSYLSRHDISAKIYNADIYQNKPIRTFGSKIIEFIKNRIFRYSTLNVDFARSWPSYHAKVQDQQSKIWQEVAQTIAALQPKIVGISSKVVDIPSTLILAEIAKKMLPGSTVIVGGPSASTCSEYLMSNSAIDFIVLGEGEETICELAQAILSNIVGEKQNNIRGIGYRNADGCLVTNEQRPLIKDLDEIPFPDRDSMFIIDRHGKIKRCHEYKDILTSRGCPFPCTFCCAYKAWGTRKPRYRSIESIIDELDFLLSKYGSNDFIFWDDLFTSNSERVKAFCKIVLQRKMRISWVCLTHLNTIDEELLLLMKAAGCREIQIGIESGSDRILSFIKKEISREIIFAKVPILKKVGIPWHVFLIIGFPTETVQEMDETMRLIAEIRPHYVYLGLFCPYPGTDLYNYLIEHKQLGHDFMKSDMWYPYHNYTGIMNDDIFQSYAFKSLKLVDYYNAGRR